MRTLLFLSLLTPSLGCNYARIVAPPDPCPDPPCHRATDRFRHEGEVEHAVFSPSGRFVASADEWGGIKVWLADTGEELGPIAAHGHCRYALALAFAPDDGTLFTCTPAQESAATLISEWYLDGALRREIRLDLLSPWCRACFSADASTAAFQSTDWTTYVIDLKTGRIVLTVPGKARSYAVALSTDGRLLATVSEGTVSIWDVASSALLRKLDPRMDRYESPPTIDAIAFSPDGRTVAIGLCSRGLSLFPVHEGPSRRVAPLESCPTSIVFSSNGGRIAAGNGGGISMIEVATGAVRTTAEGLRGRACLRAATLGLSPDGRTFASGVLNTNSLYFWDAFSGRLLPLPSCTAR